MACGAHTYNPTCSTPTERAADDKQHRHTCSLTSLPLLHKALSCCVTSQFSPTPHAPHPQNVLLKTSSTDPRGFTVKLTDMGLVRLASRQAGVGKLHFLTDAGEVPGQGQQLMLHPHPRPRSNPEIRGLSETAAGRGQQGDQRGRRQGRVDQEGEEDEEGEDEDEVGVGRRAIAPPRPPRKQYSGTISHMPPEVFWQHMATSAGCCGDMGGAGGVGGVDVGLLRIGAATGDPTIVRPVAKSRTVSWCDMYGQIQPSAAQPSAVQPSAGISFAAAPPAATATSQDVYAFGMLMYEVGCNEVWGGLDLGYQDVTGLRWPALVSATHLRYYLGVLLGVIQVLT